MPRLCVVGGGQWGQNHIRTLHGLDMLGGIVEVDAKRLEHFAELYPNAAQFPTLDEALKAEFDGFTVATPAHTHFDLAKRILRPCQDYAQPMQTAQLFFLNSDG